MRIEFSTKARFCDQVIRRDFLAVGGLTAAGLSLADLLRLEEACAAPRRARARSVILLYMGGGPSHLDTFDPKPEAPSEFRGPFTPIPTSASGVSICEHLPLIARQMHRMALLRAVHHRQDEHQQAAHYMLTGWMPGGVVFSNEHPSFGSVVAKEKGGSFATPYVVVHDPATLVNRHHGAAFLGRAFEPLTVRTPFIAADIQPPPDMLPPGGLTLHRVERRRDLVHALDGLVRRHGALADERMLAASAFEQKAFDLVTSPRSRAAFDLSREPDPLRDRYGRTLLGQGCLLARRLVEAGVRFVTLSKGGWDTHKDNFEALDEELLPQLDRALSALVQDLHDRGLLDTTLVVWNGEFGRTPRINKDAGRDHWPDVMTLCLAGGGIQGGRIVGASDRRGEYPADRPVTPEDVWATMYYLLGIDGSQEYVVPESFQFKNLPRRVPILAAGEPIPELL